MTPEQVFSVIVALLSAPSYTRRFATDLEDAFPHVPFPASVEIFLQAAAAGERIARRARRHFQHEKLHQLTLMLL